MEGGPTALPDKAREAPKLSKMVGNGSTKPAAPPQPSVPATPERSGGVGGSGGPGGTGHAGANRT